MCIKTNLIVSSSITNIDMKLGWIYTLRHKKVVLLDILWRNHTGLTSRWACGYSGKMPNLMPKHFIILRKTSWWFLCTILYWRRGPQTDCENVDCLFWHSPTMLDPTLTYIKNLAKLKCDWQCRGCQFRLMNIPMGSCKRKKRKENLLRSRENLLRSVD